MDKTVRDFKRDLQGEGLTLLSLNRTKGKHYKAVVRSPDGREMTYTLASTNSDWRASRNRLADIKRFFNN